MRKTGRALTVGMVAAATVIGTGVSPASAAPTYYYGDDCGISQSSYYAGATCADGLMLYYHSNGVGATASIVGSVSNLSAQPTYAYEGSTLVLQYYTDFVFWGMASANNDGEGQGVRNKAASVSNTSSSHSYTVYVSPNYVGSAQTFSPHTYYANLNSQLANNEASVFEH